MDGNLNREEWRKVDLEMGHPIWIEEPNSDTVGSYCKHNIKVLGEALVNFRNIKNPERFNAFHDSEVEAFWKLD